MKLEKIISISGRPGLYKLVSQLKNGFIIEDVSTRKKVSIGNSSQVSLLDNISMYTTDKEVPLFEVFENIAKNNDYKAAISHKANEQELADFMTSSLPNYDKSRVYNSDIKKLAQWYNILEKSGYISPDSFVKTDAENEDHEQHDDSVLDLNESKKTAPKAEKAAAPKVKASSAAKAAPKSTHRKQG